MTLKQSKSDLHQYLPDEVLIDALALLLTLGDKLGQVAALAVLHHDVERCLLFVNDLVEAPNDIFVLELPQNVDLIDELMDLFLSELSVVDLLPDHLLACGQVLD